MDSVEDSVVANRAVISSGESTISSLPTGRNGDIGREDEASGELVPL